MAASYVPRVQRSCVLLFARTPAEEAKKKRLPAGRPVFALAQARIRRAVRTLGQVDLLHAASQEGQSFAARFVHAFKAARALGYERIVAVPSDVPHIDAGVLAAAFAAL